MPDKSTPHFQVVINGTNRYERELAALSPANVRIDDREIIDRVSYTLEMSKQYRYFNISDTGQTHWYEILKQNKYFRLAYIYKYDYTTEIDRTVSALVSAELLGDVNKDKIKDYLEALIKNIEALNRELGSWDLWFKVNTNKSLNDFGTLITVARKEISQVTETVLKGVLQHFAHQHATDVLFEINDAAGKVKRYFNDVTGSAKQEFEKQLTADKNIDPHISLFLGFLKLFDAQKDQLNSLTSRHLDYCYRQLLGLKKNSATPDGVYITFALAKGVDSFTVAAGTQLNAGKDENSQTIIFTTDEEIVVGNIAVSNFKTLFINKFQEFAKVAEAETGITKQQLSAATAGGQPALQGAMRMIAQDGPGGNTGGTGVAAGSGSATGTQSTFTDENLGLVLSSSMFYVDDGQAEITLSLNFTTIDDIYNDNINNIGPAPFAISVTGASGWVAIAAYKITMGPKKITLQWTTDATASPIVSYNPGIHSGSYALQKPAVKLELQRKKGDDVSPYIFLQNLVIKSVRIDVQVAGNKNLKAQTPAGTAAPGSPFQAFGPLPQPGGYFSLRNANIFNKNLDSFNINIEWLGLPVVSGGFDSYYFKYNQAPFNAGLTNNAFKVTVQTLIGNSFVSTGKPNQFQLFASTNIKNTIVLDSTSVIPISGGSKTLGFSNAASLESEKQQDFSMPGVIRLTLSSPDAGFGFNLFPSVLAYTVIENNSTELKAFKTRPALLNILGGKKTAAAQSAPVQILPNQPFIPVIKAVSIDYKSSYSETLENTKVNPESDITIIHTNPFGYKTIYPNAAAGDICYLLPRFVSGNNLFIGLSNWNQGMQVNLLFNLNENIIENDFVDLTPVTWFYLKDNEWVAIEAEDLISDSTNNFTKNGIVKLNLPTDLAAEPANTAMPPGLAWLLATIQDDDLENPTIRNLGAMIYSITNNAVSATRVINSASTSSAPIILSANTISDLVTRQPKIAGVTQPLPSFGGIPAEGDDQFYTRVSERLRHKMRPLSAWELERIILEQFPEIRYVKCINLKANRWHMPNIEPRPDILVTVIGDVFYQATGGPASNSNIRVSYSGLSAIKDFLTSVLSARLNIAVSNPHLERLKIKCQIKFKNNDWSKEKDFERDLANYLTPWLFNPDRKIKINNTIYRSDVLGFIRSLSYVENIKGLVLVHLFEKSLARITGAGATAVSILHADDSTEYFLEEVDDDRPVTTFLPYGIFAASPPHYLSAYDSKNKNSPMFAGIGILTINDDFRIRDEIPGQPEEEVVNVVAPQKLSFSIDI